jgi:histidine ammonia-lyase
MAQAIDSQALDEHLQTIVQALNGAVREGVSHLDDDRVADRAIHACKEILDVVMEGKTSEWLGNTKE